MFRSLKHLSGFTVSASDGTIGKVKNALFDDSEWAVRYLIVEAGTWRAGRSVLISPLFIGGVDGNARALRVTLSREQLRDSPDVDFDIPVSRQQEAEYYRHCHSFGCWGGPFLSGPLSHRTAKTSATGLPEDVHDRVRRGGRNVGDSHLRSADEVAGYHVQALDGSIGHVANLLFDDETWLIEFLVVDTRHWLPGKRVVIPTAWVESVDWFGRATRVGVNREAIREQPQYTDGIRSPGNPTRTRVGRGNSGHGRRGPP